ncbi:MAG: hypothetical protein O9295_12635 [Microcystis sp. LE18-22.4A]|uniref:hypothetical protein n=1 Tax=Microcystis sp. LE18-22.4A TaxID=3016432 RepID=UPI0022C64485|nr:hypothetical protein [Microcystis sp. LE18-22.4A]MCZ8118874.1 hypothetical protein [Microcystis sp. LE18-22.4A]
MSRNFWEDVTNLPIFIQFSPWLELNFADNVFRATILFGNSYDKYRMSTPAIEGILGETESNP